MKKLIGLYLDDIRTPLSMKLGTRSDIEWYIVRNYDEFVDWIEEYSIPNVVSFDHDLAHEHTMDVVSQTGEDITIHYERYKEKTGLDAAKFLVQYCEDNELDLPVCTIHSANPVGADNIVNYLNNYIARNDKVAIVRRTIW